MKRLLILFLAAVALVSCCSCRREPQKEKNENLITFYTTGEKYYRNVKNGVEVEDFGTKFGVELYDVTETDNSTMFYYAYDGEEQVKIGNEHKEDYTKYLEETFGEDEKQTDKQGMFAYPIAGKTYIYTIQYTSKTNYMLCIIVPFEESVDSSTVMRMDE